MSSNNKILKDYNNNHVEEQLLLPFDLGRIIPNDDSVRLLDRVLEEVDYKELNSMYSRIGRKSMGVDISDKCTDQTTLRFFI